MIRGDGWMESYFAPRLAFLCFDEIPFSLLYFTVVSKHVFYSQWDGIYRTTNRVISAKLLILSYSSGICLSNCLHCCIHQISHSSYLYLEIISDFHFVNFFTKGEEYKEQA